MHSCFCSCFHSRIPSLPLPHILSSGTLGNACGLMHRSVAARRMRRPDEQTCSWRHCEGAHRASSKCTRTLVTSTSGSSSSATTGAFCAAHRRIDLWPALSILSVSRFQVEGTARRRKNAVASRCSAPSVDVTPLLRIRSTPTAGRSVFNPLYDSGMPSVSADPHAPHLLQGGLLHGLQEGAQARGLPCGRRPAARQHGSIVLCR